MKLVLVLIALITPFLFASCSFKEPHSYGGKIDTTNALTVNEALVKYGINKKCVIKGLIDEVCQNEGCWFNAEGNNGLKVMLSFEHKFTVPKDISGKRVIAQGIFYNDTTTVEELKNLAKEEDPKAITDTIKLPKIEVKFAPEGVLIW